MPTTSVPEVEGRLSLGISSVVGEAGNDVIKMNTRPEGWHITIFDHKTIATSGPLGRALLSDVKYAVGKVVSI